MTSVPVNTPSGDYQISIDAGLLRDEAFVRASTKGATAYLVSNTTVAPLYASRIRHALGPQLLGEYLLPDGEQYKTVESWQTLLESMHAAGLRRDTCVIALGGGVVGDIAGFAAASFMRGVPIIQWPTTLLAAVDSSVGGKTGVNLGGGKNIVGAFKQPQAVCIDTELLDSLPQREFRAGLAEIVKYGLINDHQFLDKIRSQGESLLARDHQLLRRIIAHCCQNKANIVAADELEQGERALLNLGHTFGHALETASGYRRWLHGEAVAIGLVCAARLSEALFGFEQAETEALIELLKQLDLPTAIPSEFGTEQLWQLMQGDKKADSSGLRFVLMRAPGAAEIVRGVSREQACMALQKCGART